jgi:pantothenate kinase-related protein Tda10
MNVNELADELETARNISEIARLVKEKVIPMLRQQQAEIETMKNPIMQSISQAFDSIKRLTDEEINTEMLAYLNSKTMGLEDFAKAILRKAQE